MDKSRRGFFGKLAAGAAAVVLPGKAEPAAQTVTPKRLGQIAVKTAHDFRVGKATAAELAVRGIRLESPEAPVIPGGGLPHPFPSGYCHGGAHKYCPAMVWSDDKKALLPCPCSCHQEARGRDSR